MSLILDALKRAERERKLEKAPDLSAIYQEEGLQKRKAKQWLWLGGAVLVVFVGLASFFWPKEPAKPNLAASASAKKALSKGVSKPKSVVRKTEKNPPPSSVALSPKKMQLKTKKKTTVSQEPLAVVYKKAKQTPVSTDMPAEEKISKPPVDVAPPLKQNIPELAPEPVVSPVKEKRFKAPTKVLSEKKPKDVLPSFNDLPESIQSVPGPLEINVHMFSPKPSERRVFINMQGYREGDVIGESGYKLIEITPNGVVIDYGKGRALLKVKRK